MDSTAHELSRVLVELGLVVIGLAFLARIASRWAFSAIPQSFGGKLEVWSEDGAGTEIALTVPASVAYGRPGERRRFWFSRKKAEGTNEQQQS